MRPTSWVSDLPFIGICRWFCFYVFGWFFVFGFGFVVVVVGDGGVIVDDGDGYDER